MRNVSKAQETHVSAKHMMIILTDRYIPSFPCSAKPLVSRVVPTNKTKASPLAPTNLLYDEAFWLHIILSDKPSWPVWQKVFKGAVKIQCFICVFWF